MISPFTSSFHPPPSFVSGVLPVFPIIPPRPLVITMYSAQVPADIVEITFNLIVPAPTSKTRVWGTERWVKEFCEIASDTTVSPISISTTLVIPSTEVQNLGQDVALLEAGGHLDPSSSLMILEGGLSSLAQLLRLRLGITIQRITISQSHWECDMIYPPSFYNAENE